MGEFTLTETESGSSVDVRVGDRLVVRLPETPNSGYRWTPKGVESGVLEPVWSTFERGEASALGGSGTRVFTYDVRTVGETRVSLKLMRAWEGEGSVVQRFAASVRAIP